MPPCPVMSIQMSIGAFAAGTGPDGRKAARLKAMATAARIMAIQAYARVIASLRHDEVASHQFVVGRAVTRGGVVREVAAVGEDPAAVGREANRGARTGRQLLRRQV